jgi:lipid-binding SYLF domain-containing protein
MRSTKALFAALMLTASMASAGEDAKKPSDEAKKLDDATTVLKEFANMSEGSPQSLRENAAGVVVIPGMIKAGLGVGGQHGSGVLSIKNADGSWSEPVFVKMSGGSIGFQIGASSTDLVLFFMREKNIRAVLNGEFTLGGSATVAAGPVGRSGSADTSAKLDAEIYSYSRSRGAFAGVSIDGSKLYVNKSANQAFYNAEATPESIVAMKHGSGSATEAFLTELAGLTKRIGEQKASQ